MKRRVPYPVLAPGVDDFREAGAVPARHWRAGDLPERLVPTHCAFCGVQCGMYLRVDHDGKVFGVEPRNHDINRMKLCPKGVVAYQQVNHPDRLLQPLVRDGRDAPLRPATWDGALDRVTEAITRIQGAHGRDAFGVIGGASLTTEKTYLVGKFARVALRTRHIDYNGRLCMVAAATANKKAFGIDRSANPWADMFDTQMILVAGANVGETFPVATQYFWGARDRGATLVVVDPRETPLARTAESHVALRPGTDAAFFNGLLHVIVRERLTDEAFIKRAQTGAVPDRANPPMVETVLRGAGAAEPADHLAPGCGAELSSAVLLKDREGLLRRRTLDLRGIPSHDVDIRTLPETIGRRRQEALRFLASPAGERWRRRTAWVLVVALPLAFRIPVLRKHWALRFLELAGGAAILVKLGQAVRDWEPSPAG